MVRWMLPLLFLSAGFAAAELAPQPCFRACFDGSLEARSRGVSAPVRVQGPVVYRPGKFGRALLCGEGGATVDYAVPGNLRAASGTISMWVCPLDWTGEKDRFHVFFEAKDPGWLVLYRYYQGGITMLTGADGGRYSATVGPRFRWKPGQWHHIAGTWRPGGIAVYVDGKRVRFSPSPTLPPALPQTFRVGDCPWHIARRQRTLLDEVRIYPMALDPAGIAALAAGKEPETFPKPVMQLEVDSAGQRLEARLDASGWVGSAAPGRTARLALTAEGKTAPIAAAEFGAFRNDTARASFDIARLAPGPYRLHAGVLDKNGHEVTGLDMPFTKPEAPVWRGNRIDMGDEVLPPWTPLRREQAAPGRVAFRCWGRRYVFGPFLAAAESAGRALLATPVRLELMVNGKPAVLRWQPCRVKSAGPTRAIIECRGAGGGLAFRVRHRLEYDGFLWTDLAVQPVSGPVRIESLILSWRLPASQARLIHADDLGWFRNTSGRLPDSGWKSPGRKRFTDFFWLGDEAAGLAWCRESDQFWVRNPAKSALEVRRAGDRVRATVRFIAAPVTVDGPRTYGFGFMATPVRPYRKDARRLRMEPARKAAIEIIWPNGHMKYYGYPEPLHPDRFRRRVQEAHRQGRLVVPYVNLNYLSRGVPEWLFYHKTWEDPGRVTTPSDVAAMGYASMGMCPAVKDWQDFILFRIREMIEKYAVDGIYIDCWTPQPSFNPTCAWRDARGKRHPTHPIRGYREILRRVYALFRKMRPHPLLQVHMSANVIIPMLSFTDTTLDGEQFRSVPLKADYLDFLPPAKFRAEFLGRNWGPLAYFLPEFKKSYQSHGTLNLAVYLLLHDVNAWPIWSDAKEWNRFYEALDAFGIAGAEYAPYWKIGPRVRAPAGVLVSAFRRPSKVLLAVMNTGEAQDAVLALAPGAFGLRGVAGVRDALGGESLSSSGNSIRVRLQRHAGRLVLVEGGR